MSITVNEVSDFLNHWLVDCDSTAEVQASYFLHPKEGRLFLPNGATLDLNEHVALLKPYKNIKRILGAFTLTELNNEPTRVRVDGSFYFQWPHPDSNETIQGVAVFNYYIEKKDKQLKFILYFITAMPTLPGSAKMKI